MRRVWEIVWLIGLIAAVALMVPRLRKPVPEKQEKAAFVIETNGRPERLDDLVVTVRFTSPEPVEVGYIDNHIVTDLTLTIDRFDWRFQEKPLEPEIPTEDGERVVVELQVVDTFVKENRKEWKFVPSRMYCENREMLDRLFAGCPVTISVNAMVDLRGPGITYDGIGRQVHTTLQLPALPQRLTSEELLKQEEARIQREAEIWIQKVREENPSMTGE